MRIAVLSSPDNWHWHDLQRAAGARHQLTCCAFSALQATVGLKTEAPVAAHDQDLTHYDALLVRTMPPGSLEQVVFRMNTLAELERHATRVLNPARSLEVAVDKYLTLARLAARQLPVPPTITCQTWRQALEAFDRLGSDVVVKPIFGGEGRGITRIDDQALAMRAFKMLEQFRAVIYLQQFIPHEGYDLRLLVIGQQVFGMRRFNHSDWRTNVSLGASTEPLEVDSSMRELALEAAAAVECPLAGVDLLPGSDGQVYLLEVNAVPGWKALSRTLRLDVAALVLELMEGR